MVCAYIAVGSNIDPETNVRTAVRMLAREVKLLGASTVYRTYPEGSPGQPFFYNCVLKIETGLSARELKYRLLRKIESELGRRRSVDKYAPRTIDLDLIIYDDLVLEEEDLTLPDPEILQRPFLAIPITELNPALRLPGSGLAVQKLSIRMDKSALKPLKRFSELLKEEIQNGN